MHHRQRLGGLYLIILLFLHINSLTQVPYQLAPFRICPWLALVQHSFLTDTKGIWWAWVEPRLCMVHKHLYNFTLSFESHLLQQHHPGTVTIAYHQAVRAHPTLWSTTFSVDILLVPTVFSIYKRFISAQHFQCG